MTDYSSAINSIALDHKLLCAYGFKPNCAAKVYYAAVRQGCTTLGDLYRLSPSLLARTPLIGEKTIKLIKQLFSDHFGLTWKNH
jgi:hypothetical protein